MVSILLYGFVWIIIILLIVCLGIGLLVLLLQAGMIIWCVLDGFFKIIYLIFLYCIRDKEKLEKFAEKLRESSNFP